MPLERITPRRTITLDNLSFAAGSLELIHPEDVPFMMLIAFREEETAINDYYVFCAEQGVITIDDLEFLVELTADETIEVWGILQELSFGGEYPSIPMKDKLSPDDEQVAQKFSELLNGMFPTLDPPGESDGTTYIVKEIDEVLGEEGEEGDEPTC